MDSAGIGMWYLDLKTMSLACSANTFEIFGAPVDLANIDATFRSRVLPEDLPKIDAVIAEAIQTKSDYFQEYRILRPDGKIRWLRSSGRGRYGDDGTRPHLAGILFDITDDKERRHQIEEARRIAESANRAKSQFLANMSHEIRTPLGAIMGFAGLLRDADPKAGEHERYVTVIERNSAQLLRIIDDILDLSKVEAGMMTIERTRFSLPELLGDFQALMEFKALDKGIEFRARAVTPLPRFVMADPTRIRQVLMNIVGNAIKFTTRGHVELRVSAREGFLEMDVEDSGRGISPAQAGTLFRPFTQADSSITRTYGGTGLGLVLTRRLCEAMGGSFALITSEAGRGSTFRAVCQVEAEPGTEYVSSLDFVRESVGVPPSTQSLAGSKFLLVEDAPDNQALISIFLTRAGATLDIVGDGEQGYRKALSGDYAAVLMDVQMPVMDGITAVTLLRGQNYRRPILALTAHAMKEERERCLDVGFTDFLSKPVIRDELIGTLARLRDL